MMRKPQDRLYRRLQSPGLLPQVLLLSIATRSHRKEISNSWHGWDISLEMYGWPREPMQGHKTIVLSPDFPRGVGHSFPNFPCQLPLKSEKPAQQNSMWWKGSDLGTGLWRRTRAETEAHLCLSVLCCASPIGKVQSDSGLGGQMCIVNKIEISGLTLYIVNQESWWRACESKLFPVSSRPQIHWNYRWLRWSFPTNHGP